MLVHEPGMGDTIDRRPKAGHLPDFPGVVICLCEPVTDLDGWSFSPEYRHCRPK
ncbi:hypothetical protein MTBLM5_560007 [Magnetospirillum sp. LM-5]|nr:hypothetical protein MTBLM5_560007 [Magnetospirillum sp. LM-5]